MKIAKYSKALTIALPPEKYEQIKRITDAQLISMAEWVRDAVASALEKETQKKDTK